MSIPPVPPSATAPDELPCSPALVSDVLRLLDKTVRLRQMYPSGNPASTRALEGLRAAFAALWAEVPSVRLDVDETALTWCGQEVMSEPDKASDSLPWTLFKDGVRQVTLASGCEETEIEALLDIIPRVRRALDFEDDVLTLLWEQDFAFISYSYIDTVSTEGAPLDPSATPGRWPATPSQASVRDVLDDARRRDAAALVAGLDAQLGETSADASVEDVQRAAADHLSAAIAAEYATDLRRDVAAALCDIFELQRDDAVRDEAARHLDAILLHQLAASDVAGVASLLRESRLAAQRAPATTEGQRARLLNIAERVSEPALLEPLLRSLDERGERPAMHDVDALLESLGARALGALQAWSAASRHRDLRVRYTAAADRLVDEHPEALIMLVGDDRDDTALDAMRRLGALELEEAVPALAKQFARPEEPRRAAALAALAAIGTPRAMSAMERALHDDSVTLRTTALRTLMARRHAAVRHWVTDKVKSRDVREMDNGERRALFELFGTLCGDDEVPWLTGQLVGPQGFFKRKSDPETRACSAAALGRIGTEAARAALREATSIQDPLIRRAVQRALADTGDA